MRFIIISILIIVSHKVGNSQTSGDTILINKTSKFELYKVETIPLYPYNTMQGKWMKYFTDNSYQSRVQSYELVDSTDNTILRVDSIYNYKGREGLSFVLESWSLKSDSGMQYKTYYPNGQLQEQYYKCNKGRYGLELAYNKNGMIQRNTIWEPLSVVLAKNSKNEKPLYEINFNKSGQITREIRYFGEDVENTEFWYYEKGELKRVETHYIYKSDNASKTITFSTLYYKNGAIQNQYYKNKEGVVIINTYNIDGSLEENKTYTVNY